MSRTLKQHGDDAHLLAFVDDPVPDHAGILAAHEDFVAALAGIAGARDHHRRAEQRRLHVVEIFEIADAGHVFGEIIDRERPLQRQVVQVVVEQHGAIAARRLLDDLLMAGARAMHQHPGIRAGAIDDAIVGEMAAIVQHAGIDRAAGIDLRHVAGGDIVEHGDGMRADQMDLLQARHIHDAGLGADRDMLFVHVLVVGPGGSHAAPVLKLRSQSAMPIRQGGKTPR